jgi:PAS domain S-box-containing protein
VKKPLETTIEPKANNFLKSLGVLVLGLMITAILASYTKKDYDEHNKQQLEIGAVDMKFRIQSMLSSHVQFSRSCASFFMSSDSITKDDWKHFVEKSKIAENQKGFQGIAYVMIVSNNQLENHIRRFKDVLSNDYTVFPSNVEEVYTPIVFIEPLQDRNIKALGFNISTNPLMRKAIEKARDLNTTILTDKVTLIQEGVSETGTGFAMYSPIYRQNSPINTIEERRVAIKGWAASSFRMANFMESVFDQPNSEGHNQLHLKVYDGDSISSESLLFDNMNTLNKKSVQLTLNTLLSPVELNGKKWTLQFAQPKTTPSFVSMPFVVLVGGIVISFLTSILVFFLINTATFAKNMAKKLTIDLSDKNNELVTTNELLEESHSELKIAKEKAEESEEKLKLIADNLVNGMIYQVVMLDENRRKFTYLSDAVQQLYGCTAIEAMENPDLIYGKIYKDDAADLIEKEKEALKKMSIFKSEVRVINPDGTIRWSYYISRPRIIEGLVCWDGIEVDITEHKNIENELLIAKEEAEVSSRLKSAFLANMSHEIRTPMNAIFGFSELLEQAELTAEKQKKYLEIIKKSAGRLLVVINDIIDISKVESGQMEVFISEVNIAEQLKEVHAIFNPEVTRKGISLVINNSLSNNESTIRSDSHKINAILVNLVKNAIKYCDEGTIEIGVQKKESTLEFYVKDTGVGINKKRQNAIFDRFVQADIEDVRALQGSGLGLSISKAYVEMLGGEIWVESEPGKGATFYFTIPGEIQITGDNASGQNVMTNTKTENLINKIKVLVVEDDESSEIFISLAVEELSKEIIVARNGAEAVEICRNNPDIDLVLMDAKMPVMDGYKATAIIRQFNKDVIIIAQTAFALLGNKEKLIEVGCNDYITKPIDRDELIAMIKKHISKLNT